MIKKGMNLLLVPFVAMFFFLLEDESDKFIKSLSKISKTERKTILFEIGEISNLELALAMEIVKKRFKENEIKSSFRIINKKELSIELVNLKEEEIITELLNRRGIMEFCLENENKTYEKPLIMNEDLESTGVGFDNFKRPQISFKLNIHGTEKFRKITSENIGKKLAIILDGKVKTTPIIYGVIPDGKGVITGNYSMEEAKKLSSILNSKPLPKRFKVTLVKKE